MSEHVIFVFPQLVLPVDRLDEESVRRCELAYRLYTELGRIAVRPRLVLMGGRFQSPEEQTKPASELLREWFLSKGVSEDRMITEGRSVDTFENIQFGLLALINRIGEGLAEGARYYAVSEKHHVRRICWTMLWRYGVEATPIPHNVPLRGVAALKEWFYLLIHMLPWVFWFLAEKNRRSRRLLAAGKR